MKVGSLDFEPFGTKVVNFFICYHNFLGGNRGGETPVPIPNTVVKPSSADGTAVGTAVGE